METSILLNEMTEKYINLPWETIEGTVCVLQFLFVYVPAITIFLFYKFSMLNVWIKEITNNGSELILHNKTKQTIRVTKLKIKFDKVFFDKTPEVFNNTGFLLKPDECNHIKISYKKNIDKDLKLKVTVYYNKMHRKTVKVKI